MSSGQTCTCILGGAKIFQNSYIKKITKIVDDIIIGGGMSFTFSKALGGNIGNNLKIQ